MSPIFTSIAIVFLSAIAYSQFLSPQFDVALAYYKNLQSINTNITILDEFKGEVNRILASYRELQTTYGAESALIADAIPEENPVSIASFLIDLNRVLIESRMPGDTNISVGAIQQEGGKAPVLPVNIVVTVPFSVAKKFINAIQRWNRGVSISSVSMQSVTSEEEGDRKLVSLRVLLEVFFSHQKTIDNNNYEEFI